MTDATVDRLKAALEGRYAIERELGEGGMATVYLAEDIKHDRRVALKVLKPELAAVVGAERFLAEIKTTANLQHPHILPLHDSGDANGFLFYVMPFVEGETLRDRIDREKQLPVDEAVALASKVAGALQHAHEHGVIHRDIKPGNILLQDGEPVVADFGIALAVGAAGSNRLTETGLSLGTPYYMSPEQATGDQVVSSSTDTYALGSVLYEMLVGDPPYPGSTAQAVLGRIIAGKPVSAMEERPSVPANVDAVVRKALEKLPGDRFTSAQEFVRALGDEHFRYGETVTVGGGVAVDPWKRLSMGLAGLATVLALTLAWSLLRPEPAGPVTRVSVRMPDGQGFHRTRGDFDLSADGSLLVYRGVGDAGQPLLWVKRWDALDGTPIPGTNNAARPAISPDGQNVAFYTSGGGAMQVVPLQQGGVSRTLRDVPTSNGGLPRWSPDGAWIYYTDASRGLSRVPSDGGPPQIITEVDTAGGDRGHFAVDPLPGSRAVYHVLGPNDPRIQAVDVETGEIKDLTAGRSPRYSITGHLLFQHATEAVLLAAAFDVERLELTSAPLVLTEALMPVGVNPGNFAVSRTGRLVYRIGGASGQVAPTWVGRDGSQEVLDTAFFVGAFEGPRVSPDGRKVAVQNTPEGSADPQIWIYDLDQKTFSPLTFTFEGANTRPFWSPNSAEVGFLSDRDGSRGVWAQAWDRSSEARLLRAGSGAPIFEALWTPDARWLVYEAQPPNSTRLGGDLYYAAPHPDSAALTILNTPAQESVPSVSRDGRWLAYQSDESGQVEVYVRPFPGPGGVSPVSLDGGSTPVWAHNGREIVYQSTEALTTADSPGANWIVATVRTDPAFRVESRVPFAATPGFVASPQTRHFDISPDDQRLLTLRIVGGVDDELILVDNWTEELRERAGN